LSIVFSKREGFKMKKKGFLMSILVTIALVVPLLALRAQATLNAGPPQQVYINQTANLKGTTTDNISDINRVIWDFGDNSTVVNGTSPTLLNTTHVYSGAGVYNATLTVTFGGATNKTDSASTQVTVVQNVPPVANAGLDQIVEQINSAGTNVTLDGTGSSDQYNDTLSYFWAWTGGTATGVTPTALFPAGNTTVTLTVSDGEFNVTDTVNIVVQDTTPPIVNAGTDIEAEQESHAGTQIMLNGTAVDAVSNSFNFTWSEEGIILATATNVTDTTLTYTFNLGTHTVTLEATDQAGNTASDDVIVEVIDTTPPEINVTATPHMLWQPNHKYVEVKVDVEVYDICDPSPSVTFMSATSNEPDNSIGDGNTVDDIVKIDDFTFDIRAERSGPGSDRIYTITYKATDISGNYAIGTVTIVVPHNK
jgi:hypothetical protein